jgi:MFS family permease
MEEGALRPSWAVASPTTDSLLENRRFASLCLARFLSSSASHAMYYALLIVVVNRTGSSIHSGVLIFCFLLPGVLVGLHTGLAADRWPRQAVMFLSQSLRALACVAFFLWGDSLWRIYALTLGFSTIAQFNSPAESAAVPSIVPSGRLTAANALLNLTSLIAQGVGMLVLATVFMKTVGERPLFVVTSVLFAAAAVAVLSLGYLAPQARPQADAGQQRVAASAAAGGLREQFQQAWRFLMADRVAYNALVQLTLVTTAVLVLVVIIPHSGGDVLGTRVDNVAFVFAPAGLGLLAGLRLAPWLDAHIGSGRVVTIGFLSFVACLAALGFVEEWASLFKSQGSYLADIWEWSRLSLNATVAMALAVPLGFAFSLVSVAARAVLNERAPAEMQGRIFAAQMMLGSVASIVPLFIVGGLAELVSARIVIILVTLAVVAAAVYSRLRVGPQAEGLARTVS